MKSVRKSRLLRMVCRSERTVSRSAGLLGVLVSVAFCVSCWQAHRVDHCNGTENPCDVVGSVQCSPSFAAVEECTIDEDGCLVWSEIESCGAGRQCDSSGATPMCVDFNPWDDECSGEFCDSGDTVCDGNTVMECRENSGPLQCPYWAVLVNCEAEGLTCAGGDNC